MHRVVGDGCAPASVEILGQKDVLGGLHGVLEQAMDEDHVHADEVPPSLDHLNRYLADVRDELQLQGARLRAAGAGAHVELDQPPLGVEGVVHGDGSMGDGVDAEPPTSASSSREESRVAFDLDQIEVASRIDHPLEQARVITSACARIVRWDCMYSV